MNETGSVPVLDVGGDGPPLHFAHANAYPPACYRQFLHVMRDHYHVRAMEQRPLWPGQSPQVLDGWQLFAHDLIRALEQTPGKAVVGAGHSLGAVVTMMAAVERPHLFSALVIVEPVLLPPHILQAIRANPRLAAQTPMVRRARNRRNRWPDRQCAFERFREKGVFARLSDDALLDYVNYGLAETPEGGVTLRFPREWEAAIYSHPPLDIWHIIPQITVPTLCIRGQHSDTVGDESWQRWQEMQADATFAEIADSGHLVPLERPSQVAQLSHDFLRDVLRLPT